MFRKRDHLSDQPALGLGRRDSLHGFMHSWSRAAVLFLTLAYASAKIPTAEAATPLGREPTRCPEPRTLIEVSSRVDPVTTASTLTLGQIEALAARSLQQPLHKPLGFYVAKVLYRAELHRLPASMKGCQQEVEIKVSLALVDRRIETASDLRGDTCLPELALKHYTRHAEADEHAFRLFIPSIPIRLKSTLRSTKTGVQGGSGDLLNTCLETALNIVFINLDKNRRQAQVEVDDPDEIIRMAHPACEA